MNRSPLRHLRTLFAAFFLLVPLTLFAGGSSEEEDSKPTLNSGAEQEQPAQQDGSSSEDSTAISSGEPAAVVNGTAITQEEFQSALERNRAQMQAQGQSVSQAQIQQLRTDVLESLITQELLFQESKRLDISVSAEEVTSELSSIKGQFPDEERYAQALEQAGVSEEELRADIKRNLAIEKLVTQEIENPEELTEEELRAFYDENPDLFESGERIKARHILISTQDAGSEAEQQAALQEAQELRQQIVEEDADFAAIAKEHSDGPSAENGGRLGTFSRGQMVPAFEEAAFALDVGQISEPVKTQFGYHVIQVTDKIEAGTAPYEEQRERIRQYLTQQRQRDVFDSYLSDLKEAAEIERNIE